MAFSLHTTPRSSGPRAVSPTTTRRIEEEKKKKEGRGRKRGEGEEGGNF
jgi:hypothetical protein